MNSTIDTSSSRRFSSGVPVSTMAYGEEIRFTLRAVRVDQFLILCASSRMTRSGPQREIRSRSAVDEIVAGSRVLS